MNNITFKQLRNMTEDQAREMLEQIRWNGTPVCPHCDGKEAYKLTPKGDTKTKVRNGVYKCKACRKRWNSDGTLPHQDCGLAHGFLSDVLIQERYLCSPITPYTWSLL